MRMIMDGSSTIVQVCRKINAAIKKHKKIVVEITRYSRQNEISLQQMAWLHCEEGPFKVLADYQGCSELEAELLLKRECCEQLFMAEMSELNMYDLGDKLQGRLYYECQNPNCHRLIEPKMAIWTGDFFNRTCPHCTRHARLVFIKSKKMLTVKQTTRWIENIFTFMDSLGCPVKQPNKDWRLDNE